MSKKCIEEFNPWPPFVDIFSSVILVMLLFLMVTLVNLGYYAQFKFKITHSGTISTDNLILNDHPAIVKQDILLKESIKDQKKIQKTLKKEIVILKKIKKEILNDKEKNKENMTVNELYNLELAGRKFYEQFDDNSTSKQDLIQENDKFILTFKNNEIIIDNGTIKKIKEFIAVIKKKDQKHKVVISSVDPTGQVSATIAKQISLARALNTRNLIRKLNYNKKDVKINLLNPEYKINESYSKSGYLTIEIKND